MTYNLSPKIAKQFFCDLCHYKCSKQSDYNKHLLTAKHRNTDAILTNTDFNATKVASNMFKCKCGKEYKHRQSLFNHRKICKSNEHADIELYDENQKTPEITQLITYLMNENSELKNMMMKVLENGIHSKYSDQYNKLIVESMGGSGNNDLEKEDKIIRNIVKNVVVDKDPGSL